MWFVNGSWLASTSRKSYTSSRLSGTVTETVTGFIPRRAPGALPSWPARLGCPRCRGGIHRASSRRGDPIQARPWPWRSRCRGRIVHVHERPHAPAVADDRHLALPYQVTQTAVLGKAGSGPIEEPVPQHDPLDGLRSGHDRLDMPDRVQRPAHRRRRIRIERILLGRRAPGAAEVAREAIALSDH